MYCCGVLPIQTITEFRPSVQLILSRVSKVALEAKYRIKLPPRDHESYTVANFLSTIALKKGWVTGSSNPNIAVAAKQVLKDYTTGALVHVNLRPDYDEAKHGKVIQSGYNLDNLELEEEDDQNEESKMVDVSHSAASTIGGESIRSNA